MTAGANIRADGLRATESLYGPTRMARPNDLDGACAACPFCPGNEHLTAPLLTLDPGPDWRSRVVENLFPAVVEPDGRHEVIIETRGHDVDWSRLDAAEVEAILRLYRERERTGYADGYAHVAVFKNSGARAGASLHHPHAQVVALRRPPRSIVARIERLADGCAVCAALAAGDERVVLRGAGIVAYVPDGARTAFEVRLAPAAHAARFSTSSDATLGELATALAAVMKRLGALLGEGFPFNLIVQSAPRDPRAQTHMHWEIEVIPRRENFGGFELGTGSFLVSCLPEDAARRLRTVAGVARA